MRTAAMKQRAGFVLSDEPMQMTPQLAEQYINFLKAGGRSKQTVRTYLHSLEELYDFLPLNKEIDRDILGEWKVHLKAGGYSDSTVNLRITAANGFLRYCGREELASTHERIVLNEEMPEMSRAEYLKFLSGVRETGKEQSYFLVKVFATVDIGIGELKYLTVESCREGIIFMPGGKYSVIPSCLRDELLGYADRRRITAGPVFVTRSGKLMDRSNIANSIRRMAVRMGADPEKCCPSALHRIYLTTQREIMERVQPICTQSYESLLNTEQTMVAWEG